MKGGKVKACFAVENEEGLDSVVCRHSHRAPAFVIIDTGSGIFVGMKNKDLNHVRGACNPVMAMGGGIDAVVVGGMGIPAMTKLHAEGIEIYVSVARTVGQNMESVEPRQTTSAVPQGWMLRVSGPGRKRDEACARRWLCNGDPSSCG